MVPPSCAQRIARRSLARLIRSLCCAQFKTYLFIECCIWLPSCYFFCYRFQPTIRLARSPAGRQIVLTVGGFLERNAPSMHAKLATLVEKAQGAPAGRAAAEWALANKVLAPIGFPTKMWIAHKVVKRQRAQDAAPSSPAR